MEENKILEEYMMMIHQIVNNFDEFTDIDELEEIISEIENILIEAESDEDLSDEDYEELSDLANDLVDELYDDLLNLKKENMKESKKIIRLTESELVRLVKSVLNEQGATGAQGTVEDMDFDIFSRVINGTGATNQKVAQLCSTCEKTNIIVNNFHNNLADNIRFAVQGVGTDEDRIYKTLGSIKKFQDFCGLVKAYKSSYGVSLYNDLDSDMNADSEWRKIMIPIRNLYTTAVNQKRSSNQNISSTPKNVSQSTPAQIKALNSGRGPMTPQQAANTTQQGVRRMR